MRRSALGAILFGLISASLAFSQNAQLGGSVSDPAGALIPGVTIKEGSQKENVKK